MAEHGTWLATIIYAYDRGGVDEAGLVAFLMLCPALIVAPVASFAADRFDSGRVLATGYAIQALTLSSAGLAIAAGAPSIVVYLLAGLGASAITLTRPAMGVVLPCTTRTPADQRTVRRAGARRAVRRVGRRRGAVPRLRRRPRRLHVPGARTPHPAVGRARPGGPVEVLAFERASPVPPGRVGSPTQFGGGQRAIGRLRRPGDRVVLTVSGGGSS
ncbi:MAG: hypothetical protein R2697_18810 [Ilumatobacteraceae bacterium]